MRLTATVWLVVLAACLPTQHAVREGCVTVGTRAFEAANDSLLVGTWRLRLLTEPGRVPPRHATGTLTLRRYAAPYTVAEPVFLQLPDSSTRSGQIARFNFDSVVSWRPTGARRRVYGWTDVRLADVGARTDGDITSQRPGTPGILLDGVVLWLGPPPLGFYKNDGFSTTLRVEAAGPHGFAGRWESSVFVSAGTSGAFCAERLKGSAT